MNISKSVFFLLISFIVILLAANVFFLVSRTHLLKKISMLKSEVKFTTATASIFLLGDCKVTIDDLKTIGSNYEIKKGAVIFKDHYYPFGVKFLINADGFVERIVEDPEINTLPRQGDRR
jgi:uncharacterized protein YpmS